MYIVAADQWLSDGNGKRLTGKGHSESFGMLKMFFFFFNLFICFYFWLCWVFVAVRGLSLVAASGGYSSLQCADLSLSWLLLLRSMGSRHTGFSSCGTGAQ